MEILQTLVDYVLHLEKHLAELVRQYGVWTYAILFAIIFLETGVVVTPFLPGDSLLFAAGALAAIGGLNVGVLFVLLAIAAILGDTVNYWIGHKVGPRVFREDVRFLKREYLTRTERFYEKHGGKTIFLARFVPIIRTFAPFVAGIGTMEYGRFLVYNVLGGIVWTAAFVFAGYFFGNIPVVREHFSLVIVAIVVVSIVPMLYEVAMARREREAVEPS
jgi:membrane-associated protein